MNEPTQIPEKDYLGDAVYAAVEDGMIVLTTEDGIGPSNRIYLDPAVYRSLRRYAKRAGFEPETEGA
jgi:hypothetical protein